MNHCCCRKGFGPVCFDSGILDYTGLDCNLRASSTLSSILECDSLSLGFENWFQSCLDPIRQAFGKFAYLLCPSFVLIGLVQYLKCFDLSLLVSQ